MHPKGKSIYVTIPPLLNPIHSKATLCPSALSRIKFKIQKSFEWQTELNSVSPWPICPLFRHYPYLQFTPQPSYTSPHPFWLTSVFPPNSTEAALQSAFSEPHSGLRSSVHSAPQAHSAS